MTCCAALLFATIVSAKIHHVNPRGASQKRSLIICTNESMPHAAKRYMTLWTTFSRLLRFMKLRHLKRRLCHGSIHKTVATRITQGSQEGCDADALDVWQLPRAVLAKQRHLILAGCDLTALQLLSAPCQGSQAGGGTPEPVHSPAQMSGMDSVWSQIWPVGYIFTPAYDTSTARRTCSPAVMPRSANGSWLMYFSKGRIACRFESGCSKSSRSPGCCCRCQGGALPLPGCLLAPAPGCRCLPAASG